MVEPTKTHSRHIKFGGRIISPDALYWGRYRDLVSALGFVGDCANIAAPRSRKRQMRSLLLEFYGTYGPPSNTAPRNAVEVPYRPLYGGAHAAPAPVLERKQCAWRQVPAGCPSYFRTRKTPPIEGLRTGQWDDAHALTSGFSVADSDTLITSCFSR